MFMSYRVPVEVTGKSINNGTTRALEAGHNIDKTHVDSAVSCLSDSGEAFTIIVTSIYIVPLIYLFAQFYIKSYRKQGK